MVQSVTRGRGVVAIQAIATNLAFAERSLSGVCSVNNSTWPARSQVKGHSRPLCPRGSRRSTVMQR